MIFKTFCIAACRPSVKLNQAQSNRWKHDKKLHWIKKKKLLQRNFSLQLLAKIGY